jgi:hypothetical protein
MVPPLHIPGLNRRQEQTESIENDPQPARCNRQISLRRFAELSSSCDKLFGQQETHRDDHG